MRNAEAAAAVAAAVLQQALGTPVPASERARATALRARRGGLWATWDSLCDTPAHKHSDRDRGKTHKGKTRCVSLMPFTQQPARALPFLSFSPLPLCSDCGERRGACELVRAESGAAREAPAWAHFRNIAERSSIPREGTTWERDRGTQRTEGDSVRFKCSGRLSWGRVGVAVGVVGIIVVYAQFLFGAFSLFPKGVSLINNNNLK